VKLLAVKEKCFYSKTYETIGGRTIEEPVAMLNKIYLRNPHYNISNKKRKIFKGQDSILGKGQKGKLLFSLTGNLFAGPSGRAV